MSDRAASIGEPVRRKSSPDAEIIPRYGVVSLACKPAFLFMAISVDLLFDLAVSKTWHVSC